MATEFPIRRAWSGTCADGDLRDRFANQVRNLIIEENQESAVQGYPPELVEDFVDRCDAIFAEHNPETFEAVSDLANSIETGGMYDLVGE